MNEKSIQLGELFLKEGLTETVIKESQELDIYIVEQQKLLLLQNFNETKKRGK